MQIHPVSPEQAEQLSRIAWAAKAYWGYPAHWLEAWRDLLTILPRQIESHQYFVLRTKDGPRAFVGLHKLGEEAQPKYGARWELVHLWVIPEYQGCGAGRLLFQRAVECARHRGATSLFIEADPHAEGFYLRMGAVRVGEVDATMFGLPRVLPELLYAIV